MAAPELTAAAIVRDLNALDVVSTPAVRAVGRRYAARFSAASSARVLQVVDALLAERRWPARVIAFEALIAHPAAMSRMNDRLAEKLAQGLDDWGSVDLFGVTVAGCAWRSRRITDARLRHWARSSDRWRRRLALVATVPLNAASRGGQGDATRTLAICRLLVGDRDDMVVKALSWSLRVLAAREPAAVKGFLRRERARLAPRVLREMRSKLATGRKRTVRQ